MNFRLMNFQLQRTVVKAVSMVVCLFLSSFSSADNLTVENYVALELQTRQLTLEGVKDRLVLLQAKASMDAQLQGDDETQQQVSEAYQRYGTTSSRALAWATKNRASINAYLQQHPEQQTEYDRISRELDEVSIQIQALANQ